MTRPQFPKRAHRARDALSEWGRRYPDAWRDVDRAREHRAWPDYVYLPLPEAGRIILPHMQTAGLRPQRGGDVVRDASLLAMMAAWRVTQGIYRYDPVLYAALVDTPVTGQIPGDVLHYLPAWCVYIETPDMTAPLVGGGSTPLHGAWAWLDRDGEHDVLTLGLDTEAHLAIGHVPLVGTLDEALTRVAADWQDSIASGAARGMVPDEYAAAARSVFGPLLSLLLYLCAPDADYERPERPQPKRTKAGWRLFPADRPTTWEVGVRLGAALRRAYQAEQTGTATGRTVRPHVRRAHWHTFLAGPRDSARERRVKWLPPLAVNLDDAELPAVIRRVTE